MVLVAYAFIGTLVTIFFGKRLIGLNFQQLRREADLRYGLVHVRDNAESIAFYRGEDREEGQIKQRLLAAIGNLRLLPVINKIDLPAADVERVREEIDAELGLDPFEAIPISAKTGQGVEDVLAAIVEKLPPPTGDPNAPLKVLIFDAHFDQYRGVILQCRVMEGTLKPGETIHCMHMGCDYAVEELGYNQLKLVPKEQLTAGDGGYIIAGIKSVRDIEVGDTITHLERQATVPIPGYK